MIAKLTNKCAKSNVYWEQKICKIAKHAIQMQKHRISINIADYNLFYGNKSLTEDTKGETNKSIMLEAGTALNSHHDLLLIRRLSLTD